MIKIIVSVIEITNNEDETTILYIPVKELDTQDLPNAINIAQKLVKHAEQL